MVDYTTQIKTILENLTEYTVSAYPTYKNIENITTDLFLVHSMQQSPESNIYRAKKWQVQFRTTTELAVDTIGNALLNLNSTDAHGYNLGVSSFTLNVPIDAYTDDYFHNYESDTSTDSTVLTLTSNSKYAILRFRSSLILEELTQLSSIVLNITASQATSYSHATQVYILTSTDIFENTFPLTTAQTTALLSTTYDSETNSSLVQNTEYDITLTNGVTNLKAISGWDKETIGLCIQNLPTTFHQDPNCIPIESYATNNATIVEETKTTHGSALKLTGNTFPNLTAKNEHTINWGTSGTPTSFNASYYPSTIEILSAYQYHTYPVHLAGYNNATAPQFAQLPGSVVAYCEWFSFWINFKNSQTTNIWIRDISGNITAQLQFNSNGIIYFTTTQGTTNVTSTTIGWEINNWYFFVVNVNITTHRMYLYQSTISNLLATVDIIGTDYEIYEFYLNTETSGAECYLDAISSKLTVSADAFQSYSTWWDQIPTLPYIRHTPSSPYSDKWGSFWIYNSYVSLAEAFTDNIAFNTTEFIQLTPIDDTTFSISFAGTNTPTGDPIIVNKNTWIHVSFHYVQNTSVILYVNNIEGQTMQLGNIELNYLDFQLENDETYWIDGLLFGDTQSDIQDNYYLTQQFYGKDSANSNPSKYASLDLTLMFPSTYPFYLGMTNLRTWPADDGYWYGTIDVEGRWVL